MPDGLLQGGRGVLYRKSRLALVGVLLATFLGAYASSMTLLGGTELSDVAMESFTIFAEEITISGGPPSMLMTLDVIEGVVVMNQSNVVMTNICIRKVEDGKLLEINATSSIGAGVALKAMNLVASNASFEGLTMIDNSEFSMSASGSVTLEDVEMTAIYMFAETMTLYGMKLSLS